MKDASFKVMKERCDECLFGPNKIVSDTRRKEILAKCNREDRHFICHKASILGKEACCRGFYDTPRASNLVRVMERIGCIEFVTVEDLQCHSERPGKSSHGTPSVSPASTSEVRE